MRKVILFYNTMWNAPLNCPDASIPAPYVLTTDRSTADEAVAVVFHLPDLTPAALRDAPTKKKGQPWIAWFVECEAHYPHMQDPKFMRHFDLTMSHRLDADIAVPYIESNFVELLRGRPAPKDDSKLVNAFVSSPFNQSGRIELLMRLMAHMDVHSYGKIFRNRDIGGAGGLGSKLETIGRYKFTLAFENAIARDYVTEKFYDPLIAGSVPVYLGAPNIEDFAPGDHCFINAADWDSPKSLAEYLLEVGSDDALYARFFEWKVKPFRPRFSELLEMVGQNSFVRLCHKLEERSAGRLSLLAPPLRRWFGNVWPG